MLECGAAVWVGGLCAGYGLDIIDGLDGEAGEPMPLDDVLEANDAIEKDRGV